MGETVIEKIIRNNVGKAVKPGDIVKRWDLQSSGIRIKLC